MNALIFKLRMAWWFRREAGLSFIEAWSNASATYDSTEECCDLEDWTPRDLVLSELSYWTD